VVALGEPVAPLRLSAAALIASGIALLKLSH